MKIFVDEHIPLMTVQALRMLGHGVRDIRGTPDQGMQDDALATGCFDASARFKLRCCGLALEAFPYATSSDTPRRRDIIPLAASRAGFDLASVVYFGDAPWEARVSRILGVPMIGIGRRYEQLQALGVHHAFRDYSDADRIIEVMMVFKRKEPNKPLL